MSILYTCEYAESVSFLVQESENFKQAGPCILFSSPDAVFFI